MPSKNVGYVPDLVSFPTDQMQNADHVIEPAARHYKYVVASRMAEELQSSRGVQSSGVEGR